MSPSEVQTALNAATQKSMAGFIGMNKQYYERATCYRCGGKHLYKDLMIYRHRKEGKHQPVYLCYACAMIGRDIKVGRTGPQ